MPNSNYIRPATLADAPILAELGAKTFTQTYEAYNTPENMRDYLANHFTVSALEQELQDPTVYFFIAMANDTAAGYVKLKLGPTPYISENPVMEISRYYVDAGFQGMKLGGALMQKSMDHARSMGCKALWLGVWKQNTRAVEIYLHLGFSIVGETIFQLGDDPQEDFVMAKPV